LDVAVVFGAAFGDVHVGVEAGLGVGEGVVLGGAGFGHGYFLEEVGISLVDSGLLLRLCVCFLYSLG